MIRAQEKAVIKYVESTRFPWVSSASYTITASTTTGTLTYPWRTLPLAGTTLTGADFYTAATNTTYATVQYDQVWQEWNQMHIPVMRTAEQEEANRVRAQIEADRLQRVREEASRRRLAEQVRMIGAQDRALELLNLLVSPDERPLDDLIQVRGSDGGLYRIEMHTGSVHGNVVQVDEHGCMLARVCVAPQMYDYDAGLHMPLADGWIGQYLAIKHNEAEFRARGNWSFRRECRHQDVPILGAA